MDQSTKILIYTIYIYILLCITDTVNGVYISVHGSYILVNSGYILVYGGYILVNGGYMTDQGACKSRG